MGGVGQHLEERRAEAVPGKQRQSQRAENGKLRLHGKIGQGDDEGERGAEGHPPAGNAKPGVVRLSPHGGQLEVLDGGQFGHHCGGQRNHPQLAEKDQREDEQDKDDSGEDAFHGGVSNDTR